MAAIDSEKLSDCETVEETAQLDAFGNLKNNEFMEEVRKFPVLYDRYGYDFKNAVKKENAWKKIADKFNIQNTLEVKKRYYNIRTHYGRYKKKLKTVSSECGRKFVPKPPDFDLSWLDTYIEPRTSTSSKNNALTSPSSSSAEVKIFHIEKEENSDNDGAFEDLEEENRLEATGKRDGEKALDNELLVTMKSLRHELRDHPEKDEKDDEDMFFARSIVPKLRRISPRLKSLAQMQILQVITQYEAQSEMRQVCGQSPPVTLGTFGMRTPNKGMSVTSTTHAQNAVESYPSPALEERAASPSTEQITTPPPFEGMGIPPVFPK